MKYLLTLLTLMVCLACEAANPTIYSFTNFNTQFTTPDGTNMVIKSGALLTNVVLSGNVNGNNITNLNATELRSGTASTNILSSSIIPIAGTNIVISTSGLTATINNGINTNLFVNTNESRVVTITNAILGGNAQAGKITNIDNGKVNIDDYVVSATPLVSAFTAWTNHGGTLYSPFGIYATATALTMNGESIDDGSGFTPYQIRGNGPGKSELRFGGTNTNFFNVIGTVGLNISDVDINGSIGTSGTNTGVYFSGIQSAPIYWSNVRLHGWTIGASLGTLSGDYLYGIELDNNSEGLRLPALSDNVIINARGGAPNNLGNRNAAIEVLSRGNAINYTSAKDQNGIVVGNGGAHRIQGSGEAFTNAFMTIGHPFGWPFFPDLTADNSIYGIDFGGGYFNAGSTSAVIRVYFPATRLNVHDIASSGNIVQFMTNTAETMPITFDGINTTTGSNLVVYTDNSLIPSTTGHVEVNQQDTAWTHSTLVYKRDTNGTITGAQYLGTFTTSTGTNFAINFTNSQKQIGYLTGASTVTLPNVSTLTNKDVTLLYSFYSGIDSNTITFPTNTGPTNIIWASEFGTEVAPTNIPASTVLFVTVKPEVASQTNIIFNYRMGSYSPTIDTNAQNFFNAASITNTTQKAAINTLVVSLKNSTNGLWTNSDCIYPLVGGSSNSCSWNLANTNLYRIWWTNAGGLTFNANGVTGDGATGAGNTQFTPSTASSPNYVQNSSSIMVYNKTAGVASGGSFISSFGGGNFRSAIRVTSAAHYGLDGLNLNTLGAVPMAVSPDTGSVIGTRTSSTSEAIYCNNVGQVVSTSSLTSTGVPTDSIGILARWAGPSNGFDQFCNANIAFVYIGGGLSSAGVNELMTIVTQFETTLGRQ